MNSCVICKNLMKHTNIMMCWWRKNRNNVILISMHPKDIRIISLDFCSFPHINQLPSEKESHDSNSLRYNERKRWWLFYQWMCRHYSPLTHQHQTPQKERALNVKWQTTTSAAYMWIINKYVESEAKNKEVKIVN